VQIAVSRPPESIRQLCVTLNEADKPAQVVDLLQGHDLKKVIIFAGKKQRVKDLTRTLRSLKIDAHAMHSDLEQHERDQVMLDFRNGKIDVLVATDVVSRGIDVTDIPLVVNYDVPHDPEDYVHRIGRTARAANKGEAVTLVSAEDVRYWNRIEGFLKKKIECLSTPYTCSHPTQQRHHKRRKH
jgi:superfamily II DNA/RNA helicase